MAEMRVSRMLPAIKCSDCGAEIEISRMGEHVCKSRARGWFYTLGLSSCTKSLTVDRLLQSRNCTHLWSVQSETQQWKNSSQAQQDHERATTN